MDRMAQMQDAETPFSTTGTTSPSPHLSDPNMENNVKYMNLNFISTSDSSSPTQQPQDSVLDRLCTQSPIAETLMSPGSDDRPRGRKILPPSFPLGGRKESGPSKEDLADATEKSLKEMGFNANETSRWKNVQPAKESLYSLLKVMIDKYVKPNVQIRIGDIKFNCHMMVLQCYSDFFMEFSNEILIQLPIEKVSPTAFLMVYNWMLAEEPLVQREGILELFSAASFLRIQPLVKQCWFCLGDDECFQEDTAFLLYLEARKFGMDVLEQLMIMRVCKFFLTLVASREYLELSVKEVRMLLSSNTIGVNSEIEILMAAVRWLSHDWEDRSQHLLEVLKCVRFTLMPSWFLVTLTKNANSPDVERVVSHPDVNKMINDGISYVASQMHYGRNRDEFLQFLDRLQLASPTQRQWIYDRHCSYHNRLSCANIEYATYKTFMLYMMKIRKFGKDHWRSVELLKDVMPTARLANNKRSDDRKSIDQKLAMGFLEKSCDQCMQCNVMSKSDKKEYNKNQENPSPQHRGSIKMMRPNGLGPPEHDTNTNSSTNYTNVTDSEVEIGANWIVENFDRMCSLSHHHHYNEQLQQQQQQQQPQQQQQQQQQPQQQQQQQKHSQHDDNRNHSQHDDNRNHSQHDDNRNHSQHDDNRNHSQHDDRRKHSQHDDRRKHSQHDERRKHSQRDERRKHSQYDDRRKHRQQQYHRHGDHHALEQPHHHDEQQHHHHYDEQQHHHHYDEQQHHHHCDEQQHHPHYDEQQHHHDDEQQIQQQPCHRHHNYTQTVDRKARRKQITNSRTTAPYDLAPGMSPDKLEKQANKYQQPDDITETTCADVADPESSIIDPIRSMLAAHEVFRSNRPGNNTVILVNKIVTSENLEIWHRFACGIDAEVNWYVDRTVYIFGGIDPYCLYCQQNEQQHQQFLLQKRKHMPIQDVPNAQAALGALAAATTPTIISESVSSSTNSSNIIQNFGDQVLIYENADSIEWNHLSNIPFGSRHHHAVAVCDGLIYLVGGTRLVWGCAKKSVFEKSVWCFDPVTLKWSYESSLPEARRDFAIVPIEKKACEGCNGTNECFDHESGFYIIGGEGTHGVALNTVWFYSVKRRSWTRKPPLKVGRYGLAAALVNNEIWIAGGIINAFDALDSSDEDASEPATSAARRNRVHAIKSTTGHIITDSVEIYTIKCIHEILAEHALEELEILNTAHEHSCDCPANGRNKASKYTYVTKGEAMASKGADAGAGGDCDCNTRQWIISKQHLRVPRVFGKFCKMTDGELFLVGGIGPCENDDLTSLADVDRYDWSDPQWVHCGEIRWPRHGHDIAILNANCFAVIGGVSTTEKTTLSQVEVFCTTARRCINLRLPDLPWPVSGSAVATMIK